MSGEKQAEEAIVVSAEDDVAGRKTEDSTAEEDIDGGGGDGFSVKSFLWHGGSAWDAWFSCASNQVAQVLLTLPYSFSQLGMLSGILLQIFYGLMGSWTAYLISVLYVEYRARMEKQEAKSSKNHVIQWFEVLDGLLGPYWKAAGLAFNCTFLLFGSVIQLIACASNIYYINDRLDKRTWTYIFGACCATTVFIPSFHNYRIWSFLGLAMTTYTAWYLTIAAFLHGQAEGVTHSGPTKLVLYFTGATNILYTFGGHAVTVEIMHAMWKPRKFKSIYLMATLYVFTLTLPSASAVYWAFGDQLLNHSNAFSLLPKTRFRDAAVILMLIHQFITFGFACTPLYFVWEKAIGMHHTKSICLRALVRLPVVVPIWFLAIIFPFFGPINSAVGALLVSFTVYIIPALAHMLTYRTASARRVKVEAEDMEGPTKTVRVRFQLRKECVFGEHFFILGDDPVFGGLWDPENALPLNWSDGNVWTVDLDLPVGRLVEFKFILKAATGEILWQPDPNRALETWETNKTIRICEDWDNADLQMMIEEDFVPLNQEEVQKQSMRPNTTVSLKGGEREDQVLVAVQQNSSVVVVKDAGYLSDESAENSSSDIQSEKTMEPSNGALTARVVANEAMFTEEESPVLVPGLIPLSDLENEEVEIINEGKAETFPEVDKKQETKAERNKKGKVKAISLFEKSDLEAVKNVEQKQYNAVEEEQQPLETEPLGTPDVLLENDIQWGRRTLYKLLSNFGLF